LNYDRENKKLVNVVEETDNHVAVTKNQLQAALDLTHMMIWILKVVRYLMLRLKMMHIQGFELGCNKWYLNEKF